MKEERLDLNKPFWDLNTFTGRWKYFAWVTDFRTITASDETLFKAKKLIEDYKLGQEPVGTSKEEVIYAKKLYESAFHPDTGDLQNVFGRMSFQVPGGMAITGAMLQWYRTTTALVFWQWVNQSFNALVNYTNRNANSPITVSQLTFAYCSATSAAMITAIGCKSFWEKRANPLMTRYVPFAAVAAANCVNIPLMRQNEILYGVDLTDENGNKVAKSKLAAVKGISQVVLSRIIMCAPGMLILPPIMQRLERIPVMNRFKALHGPLQILLCGVSLSFMVPTACAIFPQNCSLKSSTLKRFEPEFYQALEENCKVIEHLPQELRDRFTEMREMDLGVQNSMDSLEKKVRTFFSNIKKMKSNEKDAEFEVIRKEYYKTLEDADEKVNLANQMYELVDRYLRRLDQELHKFKMELEADNTGITEILEKRSLELDQPSTNSSQKENRYSFKSNRTREKMHSRPEKRRDSNASSTSIEKRLAIEKISPSLPEPQPTSTNSGIIINTPSVPPTPTATPNSVGSVSYNLGHIGAGGNAIAAAASQAIAATQQMAVGRRTASLKASYEAINPGGVHTAEFSRELTGAAQTAIAAIQETTKKHKKKVAAPIVNSNVIPAAVQQPSSPPVVNSTVTVVDSDNQEWTYDPSEPRYCVCNQVSYGDMVACDNTDCPFEWFHYPCVGITAPPKGKWYCPQCTSSMKRRGGRKN